MKSAEDSKHLIDILLRIAESKVSNAIILKYVFTKIEEILGLAIDFDDENAAAYGSQHSTKFTSDGAIIRSKGFLKALRSKDFYIQKSAAVSYAFLFSTCEGDSAPLIEWIVQGLSSTEAGMYDLTMPALTVLMRSDVARNEFMKAKGLASVVGQIKKLGPNGVAQYLYELSLVIWTLTLDISKGSAALTKFLENGAIPTMVGLIATSASRKIVRVTVAALRNLAATKNELILSEMLAEKLDKYLITIINNNNSQTKDVEVETDAKDLQTILTENYRDLSTFDHWVSEVKSGALRWGIVHTEKFWRENTKVADQDDFKLLKMLVALVDSTDETIQQIALYDLGEFTRFYPNGRLVAGLLGGKDKALNLLSSSNPEVQAQALQCVSKIMVTNWDFMK